MAKWTEGDRVRVVKREPTMEDRLNSAYFSHMGGLVGTIQRIHSQTQIAVLIDPDAMSKITADVHKEFTKRLRAKFIQNTSEEGRSRLSPEERDFTPNYVLVVSGADLEKA